MRALSPSDPYREPASLIRTESLPRQRIGIVAEKLGLWRFAWVRRLLGGRWEKFLVVMWTHQEPEQAEWKPAVSFRFREWRRVTEWSIVTTKRFAVGTMYVVQTVSDRPIFEGCAVVSYHSEDQR